MPVSDTLDSTLPLSAAGPEASGPAPDPELQQPHVLLLGRTLYVLLLCALPLAWLMQDSIRLYWQQTYHSPMTATKAADTETGGMQAALLKAWRAGGGWQTSWDAWRTSRTQDLSRFDDKVVATINQIWIDPPSSRPGDSSSDTPSATTPETDPNLPRLNAAGQVVLKPGDQVFFVGDSMMQGVAPHVRRALFKGHGIEGIDLSKQSTGLAYQGFFNWPAAAEKAFEQHPHIALMVVFLGPNDPWDFPLKKGDPYLRFRSPEWETVYRERIRRLMHAAATHHARVLWVGAPPMKRERLDKGMQYLNTLYQSEVEAGGGQFIAGHRALGYPDPAFSFYSRIEDKKIRVRIDDGVHFTITGQHLIARAILDRIDASAVTLPEPPATASPARPVSAQEH